MPIIVDPPTLHKPGGGILFFTNYDSKEHSLCNAKLLGQPTLYLSNDPP